MPSQKQVSKGNKKISDPLIKKKLKAIKTPDGVDKTVVSQVVEGLFKLAKTNQTNGVKRLLDDESEEKPVNLQISAKKVLEASDVKKEETRLLSLPHAIHNEIAEICLITPDLKECQGIKQDHEPSLHHYQKLLREHKIHKMVAEVIPLRQLKVEYKTFEAKRNLSNRFDVFLVDASILRLIPKLLGKHFYSRKRLPLPIDLKADDLKRELQKSLQLSYLPINNKGTCSMMTVGRLNMPQEKIVANILKVADVLKEKYPGGWPNVNTMCVKAADVALPFYINWSISQKVKTPKREPLPDLAVEDELSTIDRTVTVNRFGDVFVKKLGKKSQRKSSNGDAEGKPVKLSQKEIDEIEAKALKEERKKAPPRKEKRKNVATETKKNKKQKKTEKEGDEEEDDNMEEEEMRYLRQLQAQES